MLNYLSYISNNDGRPLKKQIFGNRHYCPKCNRDANPMCILNVSSLGAITEGHDWACDQCIIEWKRSKIKIDLDDYFVTPAEWEVKFLEKIGAPDKQYLSAKRYALKQIKIKYNEIVNYGLWDPSEKLIIEERYKNPTTTNKKRIRANDKEESHISLIPIDSIVYIDESPINLGSNKKAVNFNNQTVILTTPIKGKYKIKVDSPYHLNYEDIVDAY